MRRIAQAAGVSTGSLYHYFPDKRAILTGLFDLWTRRDVERIRTRLPSGASVPIRIRVLMRFYTEHVEHFRTLLRIVLEVHRQEPGPESRAEVRQAIVDYRRAVGEVLDVQGTVEHMVFSFLLGSLVHGILDPEAEDLGAQEDTIQAVWRLLTAGT